MDDDETMPDLLAALQESIDRARGRRAVAELSDERGENRSTLRAHHAVEWREARGRAVMMRTLIRHGLDSDRAFEVVDDILSGLRGDLLIPGRYLNPESER